MRGRRGWVCRMLLFLALPCAAGNAAQSVESILGSWDLTIESPQGARTNLLVVERAGDKLTAVMKSPRGERAVDNFEYKEKAVSFSVTVSFQGQELVISYKGTFENDAMKGEADFGGFASGEWSAVRHKETAATAPPAPASTPRAIDISGAWSFTVETAAGSGNPAFNFKQNGENLTGTYEGIFGKADVTGSVKGTDIEFGFKVDFQGQEARVTYTGKIESETSMRGQVRLGDLGEGTWVAKRAP